MSWFQSSNFASLAKNALKEAQKTIDKALDINEAGESQSSENSSMSSSSTSERVAAVTEAATDFFASWGVGVGGRKGLEEKSPSKSGGGSTNKKDKGYESGGDAEAKVKSKSSPIHDSSTSHKRSSSYGDASARTSESFSFSEKNMSESISDIPVTLLPHLDVPEKVEDPSSELSQSHQRSLSDTVFHLTTDFHESVHVLDAQDVDASKHSMPVLEVRKHEESVVSQESSSSNSSNVPHASHLEGKTDPDPSIEPEPPSQLPKSPDNLMTVDLNSTQDEVWSYHEDCMVATQDNSTLAGSSNTGFDSASWSWAEPEPEDEHVKEISSNDAEHQLDIKSDIASCTVTENANRSTEKNEDQLQLEPRDQHQDEKSVEEKDSLIPPVISSSSSSNKSQDRQEDTEEQLESSTGTILLDPPENISPLPTVELQEPDNNDDKIFKPPSPPVSSISVLDSPRSASPQVMNNDHDEDSRRGSPDNNFELLSNSSKQECHLTHGDFLPESSRSSSIVVVSTRASSGGSGSTASNSSDNHRDLDIIDTNNQVPHQPYSHSHDGHFERVGPPSSNQSSDPTSPEFVKTKHRKGPSSASSSDIEVILSSEYARQLHHDGHILHELKPVHPVSSTHQQTSVEFADQQTQTEHDEEEAKLLAEEIPKKVTLEISAMLEEKDQLINELREEGEKLSKKQFDLSQVVKKLRTKEKDMENTINTLKGEIAGKKVENDRLTKSFVNKETVEKTLNEQIQKLTSEKNSAELRLEQLNSELEDANENCNSMKVSVEEASIEILELKNAISSAQRDSTEIDNLTREKSELISRNDAIQKDLDSLRVTMSVNQEKTSLKERELQTKVNSLTKRLHDLEGLLAEQQTEVADATMPLSLEIEKLQTELKQAAIAHERRESIINVQLGEYQAKCKHIIENEALLKDQVSTQQTLIASLETKVYELETENRKIKREIAFREENEQKRTSDKMLKISQMEAQNQKLTAEVERLTMENEQISAELKTERLAVDHERKKSQSLQEQLTGRNLNLQNKSNSISNNNPKSGENSPSSHSVVSESSYLDEVFDPHGHLQNHRSLTPRSSFFDSFTSAGLVEHLQNQLRQRDAEVLQFQDEVKKNEKIRKSLNDEIAKLTMRNHECQVETERLGELGTRLEELEKNYNALLQLYGEKVEEADELRMDLQDVKEMYKNQIEQLLKR